MNIERLGGLLKKMPHTALLFLVAAIAICGLPPLNGFISEFLIFGGIYNWLYSANLISLDGNYFYNCRSGYDWRISLAVLYKSFQYRFSWEFPKREQPEDIHERGFWQLLPMYLTVAFMITNWFLSLILCSGTGKAGQSLYS